MTIGERITDGPFSFSWEADKAVEYIKYPNQTVVLVESEDMSRFVDLGNGTALGYDRIWQRYFPEFQQAGWRSNTSRAQMAIWALDTGRPILSLGGMHLGDLQGAEMLSETLLLTWGRDYLARIWNTQTGELVDVVTLPLGQSEHNSAIVSCRYFTDLSKNDRAQFIRQPHKLSPNVQIFTMVAPDTAQLDYGFFPGVQTGVNASARLHPPFEELSAPNWIGDMQNAEGSYSTTHILRDGRRVTGGTTYGASGIVYDWDGLFDLTLLLPSQARECFTIFPEVQPNVIEMGEWVEHYENDPLYRWMV